MLGFSPTSTDIADFIDTQEVYLDLQLSSTEEYTTFDAAEVLTDLQASGTELAEYVDAQEILLSLQIVSADILEASDAATVYLDLQPSGTEEPGVVQFLRPDADIDADSWTTAPLFSKVNDESDGTIITATAV